MQTSMARNHNYDDYMAPPALREHNDDGCIYSFGQNSYGELGLGDTTDRHAPTHVAFCDGKEIVHVACGNEFTAILCANGDVYACGYNDSGQCGIGTTDRVMNWRLASAFKRAVKTDVKVVAIYSGNGCEHIAALTDVGSLYTVGFNSRGQLGIGTTTTTTEPTLVAELGGDIVMDVACSYFHTVIVNSYGELYAWGRNDFGQLGTGDTIDKLIPHPSRYFFQSPVLSVACGQHHTVAALSGGGVVAFGKNDHGQLGLGNESEAVLWPTRLEAPFDTAVVTKLACGYHHTVAVTEDGSVYSFGRNDYGQLGLGHNRHVSKPTLVEALSRVRIVQVACGCYHTLTLSDEGKVYPFGRNNHGQLGLETSQDCFSPQIIPWLRDKVVRKIAAGFYHSVCVLKCSEDEKNKTKVNSLGADLRKMLNNPCRSDVTFVVEGQKLYAHSCILIARCEPLEKMLDGRMIEGSLPEIVIPEYSYEAFAALLEYLYADEVESLNSADVDADFVLELFALADQYLVTQLRRVCESTILRILSVYNVSELLQAAHFREAYTLKKRCLSFVMDHFGEVIATEGFIGLQQPLLQEVLMMASRHGVTIPNQSTDFSQNTN